MSSKKLDFSLLKIAFTSGPLCYIGILFIVVQFFISTYRLRTLLQTKTKERISFKSLLAPNWIGLFFSSILPGAVTGDLLKLSYIKKIDPKFTNKFLITAAFLDRLLGLLGLLFCSGVFSLIYYNDLIHISLKLKTIIWLNLFLFLGGIFFLFLLASRENIQNAILKPILIIPFLGKKIHTLLSDILALREDRVVILKCFSMSVLIQFISISTFWMATKSFYSVNLPLGHAFSFIPIGMITVAIPISPSGLGVGHAMFANLFSLFNIQNGASLFNIHFVMNLMVNLMGFIPFIFIKEKINRT